MIIAPTPETLAGQPLSVLVQMGRETVDEVNNYYEAIQRMHLTSDYDSMQRAKRALNVLGHVAERLGIATYGREMCYRYGAGALPTDNLRSDGYEVGDIAYWPPRGSLVILYAQNGEQFERQHLGHIDDGVEVFETTGDVDVTFEVAN